jgi:hypothetical protein
VAFTTPQSTASHPLHPPPLDLLHLPHPSLWSPTYGPPPIMPTTSRPVALIAPQSMVPHQLCLLHPNVWSHIHYARCILPIMPTASQSVVSTAVYGPPPIAPAASQPVIPTVPQAIASWPVTHAKPSTPLQVLSVWPQQYNEVCLPCVQF